MFLKQHFFLLNILNKINQLGINQTVVFPISLPTPFSHLSCSYLRHFSFYSKWAPTDYGLEMGTWFNMDQSDYCIGILCRGAQKCSLLPPMELRANPGIVILESATGHAHQLLLGKNQILNREKWGKKHTDNQRWGERMKEWETEWGRKKAGISGTQAGRSRPKPYLDLPLFFPGNSIKSLNSFCFT